MRAGSTVQENMVAFRQRNGAVKKIGCERVVRGDGGRVEAKKQKG